MRRAYLLVYNGAVGTREGIRDFLDGLPEVINWRYDLPYSFFLVSEASARDLAMKLRAFSSEGAFLFAEVTENRHGWLPKDAWPLIQKKVGPTPTVTPTSRPK